MTATQPLVTYACAFALMQSGWSTESGRAVYAHVLRPANQSAERVRRDSRRLGQCPCRRSVALAAGAASETVLETHLRTARLHSRQNRTSPPSSQVTSSLWFSCLHWCRRKKTPTTKIGPAYAFVVKTYSFVFIAVHLFYCLIIPHCNTKPEINIIWT